MPAEKSQTLDRGLYVLELLASTPEGLTVTEIAATLSMGRTVVYRLVVTLEGHGLVRRSADGRARLGMAVLSLARQAQPLLREISGPLIRALADATSATAYVGVVDGSDLLTIAGAEPAGADVHVAYQIGARTPLERGAAGRAILAARTTGGRALEPPWVVSTGDAPSFGFGVAAVIPGVSGLEAVVGVIALVEPHEQTLGPQVAQTAQEISRVLLE
ncbi:MAG: helix-turn-helix domain-containing protein [Candidatus Nanopelagicales bacterium]|nr:helix-turn-helix domain-containing protein [Candidatus Nanopelagicales bacterium]MDP4825781.1 helix-turn-helix domain-containing protein [Candidatus Nanopelagicales bacterium]MDP4887774.1 helix-turn-helix domain-containing protein [Candidatus Nanopelagicales bacterium]